MKRIYFLLPFLIFSKMLIAQSTSAKDSLQHYQDTLQALQNQFFKGHSDAKKIAANEKFNRLIGEALKVTDSFDFDFDSN